MTIVVADTNVIFSGVFFEKSVSGKILDLVKLEEVKLVFCKTTFSEFLEKYPQVKGI